MYRHAGMDCYLSLAAQDRGLGTEVVGMLARWLVAVRQHHRLTIDPAADNVRAIRCRPARRNTPSTRMCGDDGRSKYLSRRSRYWSCRWSGWATVARSSGDHSARTLDHDPSPV